MVSGATGGTSPGLAPPAATPLTQASPLSPSWDAAPVPNGLAAPFCRLSYSLEAPAPFPSSYSNVSEEIGHRGCRKTSAAHLHCPYSHPPSFLSPSILSSSYLAFFNYPDSSTHSSLGTVSSTIPTLFAFSDTSSMSGLRLVSAMLAGNFTVHSGRLRGSSL